MWLREVCDALEVWLLEELAELVVCVVGELEFGEELMAVEFGGGVLDGWVVDVGVCVGYLDDGVGCEEFLFVFVDVAEECVWDVHGAEVVGECVVEEW